MLRSIITVGCETTPRMESQPGSKAAKTRRSGRLHRDRGRQRHDIPQGANGPNDSSSEAQGCRGRVEIGALDENEKRKVKEVAEQSRDADAKPGPCGAADDDAYCGQYDHELDVVEGDRDIPVSQRFQKPDLLAFQRNEAA